MTVVVADQLDSLDSLSDAVRQHTPRASSSARPRRTSWRRCSALPRTPRPWTRFRPAGDTPRLGNGPVHRLQVPATPDPYDDATSDAHRQAVLDLLPPRTTPADGEQVPVDEDAAEKKISIEKKTVTRKAVTDEPEPERPERPEADAEPAPVAEPTPVAVEAVAQEATAVEPATPEPVPAKAVAAENLLTDAGADHGPGARPPPHRRRDGPGPATIRRPGRLPCPEATRHRDVELQGRRPWGTEGPRPLLRLRHERPPRLTTPDSSVLHQPGGSRASRTAASSATAPPTVNGSRT